MLPMLGLIAVLAAPPACDVNGKIFAAGIGLPGASITVSDGSADVARGATDASGVYRIALPGPGKYSLRAGMAGFEGAPQAFELTAEECSKALDVTLTLQGRPAAPPAAGASGPSSAAPGAGAGAPKPATPGAGTAGPAGAPAGRFQNLTVAPGSAPPGATTTTGPSSSEAAEAAAALPAAQGFQTETATESVTSSGGSVNAADNSSRMDMLDMMMGDPQMMAQRMAMGMDPMGMASMMMSGGGGGGMFMMSGPGGGGSQNRLQGNLSHTIDMSALDAAPYRLNGRDTQKADYTQNRVSASLSGPVKIGHLYDGSNGKTRFTLRYNGSFDHRPYDAYSTVPTEAERAGDLSGRSSAIYDPRTGAPFPGNAIPTSRIDPAARVLLDFIPLPNLPGATRNFHYVTSNRNRMDMVSANITHRFGPAPQVAAAQAAAARAAAARAAAAARPAGAPASAPAPSAAPADSAAPAPSPEPSSSSSAPSSSAPAPAPSPRPATEAPKPPAASASAAAAAPGARPAGGPRATPAPPKRPTMLFAYMTYMRYSNSGAQRFPTVGGDSENSNLNTNVSLSWSLGKSSQSSRVNFSRTHSDSLNLYAFSRDVAGEAGIGGIATDPIDWGLPNLSFTRFDSLNDRVPWSRTEYRGSIGHTVRMPWKKHSFSGGVDLRYQSVDSRTDLNARGSFTFTGIMTSRPGGGVARDGGDDFADFLLGLPQQTSVQYGPGNVRLRAAAFSVFAGDDWRLTKTLTLNAGLRYELAPPYYEAGDHLVNLDVPDDFTAAVPVLAEQTGPFSGAFPRGLVKTDGNNIAPRIGLAWQPKRGTTVRAGYGVNYNGLGANWYFAQRLAGQPPFAVSNTSQGYPDAPLTFIAPFVNSAALVTNSYGIDRDYELGRLQVWNLDAGRDMGHGWNLGAGYAHTTGAHLDLQRAPNRDRNGLRIPNVQAFLWQSSDGESTANMLMFRLRKRLGRSSMISANYSYGKSTDNASSIGGGGWTVAQDDRNLAAERGRSSFDRRHRLFMTYNLELPFGPSRRYLQKGLGAALAGGWTLSGSSMFETGGPLTVRVRGDFADVGRGVNSTLRADYTGAAVGLDNPTTERWFNTDAFVLPAPGLFGTAGRNTIDGPGTFLVNMTLGRDISLGRPRSLSLRLQANNLLNSPQWGSVDTFVNSPTFGQVTSVRNMRTIQITTSVRF
jgi:outer membrane receptor protein involved in Fe transport